MITIYYNFSIAIKMVILRHDKLLLPIYTMCAINILEYPPNDLFMALKLTELRLLYRG